MKFKIIYNERKGWAQDVAAQAGRFVLERGGKLVERGGDVSIVVGGDGTLFYHKDEIEGAVLGIGGLRSRVCQAKETDWKKWISGIFAKLKHEERVALSVRINKKQAGWAMNDAVVHARRHNFLELELSVGGKMMDFGGDGVIVATPTGSMGYAYSAGGKRIPTGKKAVEIVPICPYLRKAALKIFDAGKIVRVAPKDAADLILDGQKIIELGEKDIVEIGADRRIRFVRP